MIVSTHILTEVERLCTHCLILNQGSVLANGTLSEVSRSRGGERLRVFINQGVSDSDLTSLSTHNWVDKVEVIERADGRCCVIDVEVEKDHQGKLMKWFEDQQYILHQWYWHHPTLEDVFLSAVGIE